MLPPRTRLLLLVLAGTLLQTTTLSVSPSRALPPHQQQQQQQQQQQKNQQKGGLCRRDALRFGFLGFSGAACSAQPARAYDNAVPEYAKYADKPKRRGAPPKDLGVLPRVIEGEDGALTVTGLRQCDGKPNCFSTTGDEELDERVTKGVDNLIPSWQPPADDPAPLKTLAKVIRDSYKPGQGGIDGGGFQVAKESDAYLYVQFESLKKGFIDDVEFAVTPKTKGVLVRSSSRVGYTDFAVNALRLNSIAASLRAQGWAIAEITAKTHNDYWGASDEAREGTFDADRRKMDGGTCVPGPLEQDCIAGVDSQIKPSQVFNR